MVLTNLTMLWEFCFSSLIRVNRIVHETVFWCQFTREIWLCESCGLVLFSVQHNILSLLKTIPLCLPCNNTYIDNTAAGITCNHQSSSRSCPPDEVQPERFRCLSFLHLLAYYFKLFPFMLFIQWVLAWDQSKAHAPVQE